jgi:hypothetical protein
LKDDTQTRLTRIESRLVQIMLHLGMDPYRKMYTANASEPHNPDPASFSLNSQSGGNTQESKQYIPKWID